MYKVTSWRVHTTIVAVEKAISITFSEGLCVCVCSLSYSACNVHAPYCRLWPAPLYNIFPHHPINGIIKKKSY